MPESLESLETRLAEVTSPSYRGRLLDRGLARGLIWTDGELPQGSPRFAEGLSEDLLDYGHSILALALRLRKGKPQSELLNRAFLVAGESIEAAVHRGQKVENQDTHRVTAACAFHLARYSARAFSVLPHAIDHNYSSCEYAIVCLLRRRLGELRSLYSDRLVDESFSDDSIADRLLQDDDFDRDDAIHEVLVSSFMRAIGIFDHATLVGSADLARMSVMRMFEVAETASLAAAANHWWTSTLAAHLMDELWGLSLHNIVPILPPTSSDGARWNQLRLNFIHRIRFSERPTIELWPSQLEAAVRAVNKTDDLVVALPTSAGKTRIAELCILRALASDNRVIYVTPLRALSAQIERDLGGTFRPLGFSVSALYGAAGVEAADRETLTSGDVVVVTPEKLDFALRNNPTILDDVGLIVFDEGHMLGVGEREVRYEALMQRILRMDGADERRIVCLSALFPDPSDMRDLVGWIRQDQDGLPVHCLWRPTRQRFGTICWDGESSARLDVRADQERSYVDSFIEAVTPTVGSRINPFPQSDHELTLASAWKFVAQDKRVLIYCALKKSVGTLSRLVLTLIRQRMLSPLVVDSERLRCARLVGAEWLGATHPAVKCLEYGVAIHHGGLPRPFLSEVEALLRDGYCKVTIASPTLAQGLNLSASVLLVPSIWRNRAKVPVTEFANVIGRAGRAFVDLEGLVLHRVWKTGADRRKALRDWERLVDEAKAPKVLSGILQTTVTVLRAIADRAEIDIQDVIDYVLGNSDAWTFFGPEDPDNGITEAAWDRDIVSLDSALLGTLEADESNEDLEEALGDALNGSLFARQADSFDEELGEEELLRFLAARAKEIWSRTDQAQRRGFYAAGIGLKAGLLLTDHLEELLDLLWRIEGAISVGIVDQVPAEVIEFAEYVLGIAPFRAPKPLPDNWGQALEKWMQGHVASEVVEACGDDGVDFIQEAISYRLPWAMEAVRAQGLAMGFEKADVLTGVAAMAVQTGSLDESVMTLLQAGLQSREGAKLAVHQTGASFTNKRAMRRWMKSDRIVHLSMNAQWPSPETAYSWQKFIREGDHELTTTWERKLYSVTVKWWAARPPTGTPVIVTKGHPTGWPGIFSSDYQFLAYPEENISLNNLTNAYIGNEPDKVYFEYFGANI